MYVLTLPDGSSRILKEAVSFSDIPSDLEGWYCVYVESEFYTADNPTIQQAFYRTMQGKTVCWLNLNGTYWSAYFKKIFESQEAFTRCWKKLKAFV